MERHDELLVALRQIIRAIDLHSKRLIKEAGLTAPQLFLLKGVEQLGNASMRQLADHTNMSQATATTIMDRLESRGLVVRLRSDSDKRKVHASLTEAGRTLLSDAPTPLQESFIQRFQSLEEWEQTLLLSSLQRVSSMMNASNIDAAPVLSVRALTEEKA
ncbi:MarR family winged helix-turn-helix transcriptional regulator [Aeromonas schubertii]|uniref:MarR family transcriptional regulator n=1 Tax=Aeromonas schubertii TaxID=652 RepID=A0A0S2SNW8_9GAMM|nr:MarR family transcriptional regulator [Aeromonas schubertii]ALP43214.1 MarR family transcriptional regulator [Aeromonas schubertii]KUE78832.1 MarR family transcriptional regulator [Aeromonas schubertii]MBZ6065586.1 MarR family transcriptional regulator [Aeromonas schubertii]MBZ6072518.1 MarR family transcriptional regulator [Aeromonas schubertii]QCG46894.1 MarR family transcriptional regulator [Aeromonas schubertii]